MTNNIIQAVIFDLDGVITDTAEYHFLAWKRLADEEDLPFTRQDNEHLRGVSRREPLARLLKGVSVSEEQAGEMMARKNGYYREFLTLSGHFIEEHLPLNLSFKEMGSTNLRLKV